MTHLEAIRTELLNASAVTALVASRIYPHKAPQGATVPFVVITTISSIPFNSMTGTSGTRLRSARVQVDSYAKTYLEVHQLADAVDTVIADLTRDDLSAVQESSADLYDDETELRRVSADYFVAL